MPPESSQRQKQGGQLTSNPLSNKENGNGQVSDAGLCTENGSEAYKSYSQASHRPKISITVRVMRQMIALLVNRNSTHGR